VPYIATTESTLGIALSPAFNLVVVNMCYAANCCEEKQRGAVCVVSSQPQSLRNNYFSFSADSNEPLIKCSTRKGYALSNPIQLIAKFRGSIKKCVARSACMGLDIENRHNRRRRARHGVCSSSRSSWPPRDLGLATCQSYTASSHRRNHSGR
jgi:hypothetical protein